MVIEARNLVDSIKNSDIEDKDKIVQSLNAMGYDEAAQYVYGMKYEDWKVAHSRKASDEQMQRYQDSMHLWAGHDKDLLAKRADEPAPLPSMPSQNIGTSNTINTTSLLSNVCCQDPEDVAIEPAKAPVQAGKSREVPPFQPPGPPSKGLSFSLGILTVSDRASSGEYKTGDLSGPAVKDAVSKIVEAMGESVTITKTEMAIVPDEIEAIEAKLKVWADMSSLDLILTTGGTGFAPRDVTPEATLEVVDKPCPGLVSFCTTECSKRQPLASLSRGTAGLRGKTLIVNLPGNPQGVHEIVPILLPLTLHALSDLTIHRTAEF